jgi:hypothetical protein
MAGKQKKRKLRAKREKRSSEREHRRLEQLTEQGRLVNGVEIPHDAVVADHSKQVPSHSYMSAPDYYVDIQLTCRECGKQELWIAEDQKWYYEVAKGSLYSGAVRCYKCREAVREQCSGSKAEPNTFAQPTIMLGRSRSAIATSINRAGFSRDGRNEAEAPLYVYLVYSRPGEQLRVAWDRRNSDHFVGFTAELVRGPQ